jgi:phosphoglycolate phosphatase-like HAD superfamily hydrolase
MAAEAAGIPTLAVMTGGFSEGKLREAGAAEVVKSIGELRKDRSGVGEDREDRVEAGFAG